MAKINDLQRAIALDYVRCVHSKNNRYLFDDSRLFRSLSIKFGQENRKGIGSVKVTIQLYILSKMYKITIDGWYNHLLSEVDFKCITIECNFSPARLYSLNNFQFNGLWQEEEVEDDAPVTVSVEVADDGNKAKPVTL